MIFIFIGLSDLFHLCTQSDFTRVENDADFAVLRDGGLLFLLFQKSDGGVDWVNNFDFSAVPYHDSGYTWNCHRGFLSVWKAILPYIEDEIADRNNKYICVAGYSHGGAVAAICHEYITAKHPELKGRVFGYSFGSPRVFRGMLTEKIAERWRSFTYVRNSGDIVTHLPPVLLGYRHVGTPLVIGKRGRYSPIKAHYEENYIAELEKSNSAIKVSVIL